MTLKAQIKKIWIYGNELLGKGLPVIDYRNDPNASIPSPNIISKPILLKEVNPRYNILTGQKPYWLSLFINGVKFPSFFYLALENCFLIGQGNNYK